MRASKLANAFPRRLARWIKSDTSKYIGKRLLAVIPTFLGVTLIAFFFIRLIPGDPLEILAGERGLDPERHQQLLQQYGLADPLWQQYLRFVGNLLQGDLGKSLVTKTSVMDEFLSLFPATIELSLAALLFAVGIGLPAGIAAARRRGSAVDYGVMSFAITGYSMPIFWWGLLLIIFFSGLLGLTPVSGRIATSFFIDRVTGFLLIDSLLAGNIDAFLSALAHLILPMIALGTIPLAVIARQTRSAMLEVMQEDYIRTARAKGMPEWRVIWVHALRNALIPVVTTLGLQTGVLLAGAILTETIFSWPGIGKWLVHSIYRRDYPSVQGGLVMISLIVMTVNLTVDITYGMINPKVRDSGE